MWSLVQESVRVESGSGVGTCVPGYGSTATTSKQ